MNVALVTPRYPPTHAGGGEISARLLAEQLSARNWIDDVTVYAFDGDTTETVGGVTVHRLGAVPQYPYTLPNELAYRRLRSRELDADLLHAYNMHLHPTVGRLAAERGLPSVATLNAYPLIDWADIGVTPSLQRRLYEHTVLRVERPRLKRQMRNVDVFLPLSGAVERVYREHGFADADFEVVPNMIDPTFDVPAREPADADRIRLLYVGYLRDSKGVRFLVDAIERLPSQYTLTVVGGGPEQQNLIERASDGGAAERITFTGQVPYEEVAQAYADADVFVHPGVWPEPFGRTILEAMQAGLPVVATAVGGPAETVPQSKLLCDPGDPDALRESIEYAAANRERIGSENERTVRQEYHPDAVVPRFRRVYERVLDRYE
ncbi:glycosyltransferase family 4 protein [Haloplanus rubicundus]|uniref:Glycosyltransferase family 1 protein n=1 Tax=Haloplanus rubicundus TaxID=1547898 RepID=A0A345EG03_9EURY|nr:glycosyltransferase family 4 protein [Haloplanus rubicundus]AXG11125.1 glycosyltransferase family 1 protein [Haloplanus rubicundus]